MGIWQWEELYSAYNQILSALTKLINNPQPWLLK